MLRGRPSLLETLFRSGRWHEAGGGYHTEPPDSLGTLSGHEIYEYSKRYYIEGSYDYITWEITRS